MSSPNGPANEFVRPAVRWSGTILDAEKEKALPQSGVITWGEPFAELWAAWELGTVPHVDFGAYFVVAVTGPYGADLCHLMVGREGRSRAVFRGGLEADRQGTSFSFSIGVFPRAGIETCHDVAVARREAS